MSREGSLVEIASSKELKIYSRNRGSNDKYFSWGALAESCGPAPGEGLPQPALLDGRDY